MKLKLTRPLAFFDLETTGVNVATDRIVEISIVRLKVDGTEDIKTELINPTIPIPPETTKIHGISDEDVKDKPTFGDLAADLANFLHNCDLSGYNIIKFDLPLIVEEFLRVDIDFELKNRKIIDVQNIFHKMEPRTLKAAHKFYCGTELKNAHSAEADTIATYEVLKAQLDKYEGVEYEDRDGNVSYPVINNMDELSEFSYYSKYADLKGHIVYNDKGIEVINFGKHKGKPVEKVLEMEPQYYDWMMKAEFPLYTKKVLTAIKLRGFNKGDNQSKLL